MAHIKNSQAKRNRGVPGAAAAVLAALVITGCATVPEQALREQHEIAGRALYARPAGVVAEARFAAMPATLDEYLRQAFGNNADLRSAFERWQAALERIPQARALDEPNLSFEYFIEQMDTRYQVSLTQMFPAFGTLRLREGRAAAEAQAAMHNFEAKRLILFDEVVKAFYEYHYLARATQVTAENHQLLSDLEQVVTIRYKAGLAPFADLIKVQVEKDRITNDLATLRDERASRSAILAALLNLPGSDVLPWPQFSPSGAALVDVDVLDGMLADLNPELKAAAAMINAGTYREKLAHKSFLPDFMVGASWMVMPGMNGGSQSEYGIMAGISLPVWRGKYRAEVREAEAMVRAAVNERDNMQNQLKAELRMAVFKFNDAERRISLFSSSLIPKASQALEVAKQEFSTGKADFMTLIDAQRTLLEFRLMLERVQADREIALGEIGCCIGTYSF